MDEEVFGYVGRKYGSINYSTLVALTLEEGLEGEKSIR